jgi:hypothetical protein
MDDRRKDPRVPMRAEAEVRFTSWAVFQLIFTVNISHGGMNLELQGEEPKVGSKLTVRLTPPTGAVIELEATVKHVTEVTSKKPQPPGAPPLVRKFQAGVQFAALDPARKVAIENTIKTHMMGVVGTGLTRKKD